MYFLKAEAYKDYTFNSLSSCSDIEINLSEESDLHGILHSPRQKFLDLNNNNNYNSPCKWTLNAPSKHQIELTFIEYETPDCKSLSKLSIESNDELFIKLDAAANHTSHKFNANQFRSCEFGLKQFTKLESKTNRLVVKTKPYSEDFLIYFSIRKIEANECASQEFKCNVE